MKKVFLLFVFACIVFEANAAYWICKVSKNVNFRECPSTECGILCKIPAGAYVVAEFEDSDFGSLTDFVQAVYIDENMYGYVSSKFLQKERIVDVSRKGIFDKIGTGVGYDPELEICNNTNLNIIVSINHKKFDFTPYESRTITCPPGKVDIMASAPGVIPFIGEDIVDRNGLYNWKFFIRTRR